MHCKAIFVISAIFLIHHVVQSKSSTSGQILERNFLKKGGASKYSYRTEYFETYIDHFNYANDAKFKVKYLINEDFYIPGGSILFYTGNEGLIEAFAENTGIMWVKAKELKSTVIFMEHRYYGSSMPFGENSFKNRTMFAYFTAEQALADYASFLDAVKSNPKYKHAPVIAIGGSYGGMLAAWFRAKYPNLVSGALAASAPVFGFVNMTPCNAFSNVLTEAFRSKGSESCPELIRKSWDVISRRDPNELTREFRLCKSIPSGQVLVDYLNEFYGEIAMVNYPYAASFLGDYPAWPVTQFCKPLNQSSSHLSDADLMAKISEGLFNNKNYTGKIQCLDINEGGGGVDASGWFLQTCMEMQLPMCSDGVTDMFLPQPFDQKQTSDQCFNTFDGLRPRFEWPNVQFWGKALPRSLTNIIYSNGQLDPWSGMGVLKAEDAPGAVVLSILNGAHHIDLREPNVLDPVDVTAIRQAEWNIIEMWINWHYEANYYKDASFN